MVLSKQADKKWMQTTMYKKITELVVILNVVARLCLLVN
ncbi:MAG: hypothetical protein ACI815_001800 [Psychroserpens sp.]|jgi:hypothetical protein